MADEPMSDELLTDLRRKAEMRELRTYEGVALCDEIDRLRAIEAALWDEDILENAVKAPSPSSRIDGQRRHAIQDFRKAVTAAREAKKNNG